MIKGKDFEKAQTLMKIRDVSQNAWHEMNFLSKIVGRKEKEEICKAMKKLYEINKDAVDKLGKMIDWSDEE